MAKIASKTPWGVPLVLPHVLLSVGLLILATMSEGAAQPAPEPSQTADRDAGALVVPVSTTASETTHGI